LKHKREAKHARTEKYVTNQENNGESSNSDVNSMDSIGVDRKI
jgi:hypothetical protein